MNKICTTKEQSKILMELGLDVNTADMYYPYLGSEEYGDTPRVGEGMVYSGKEDIPSWSLSALLGLLPSEFTEVGEFTTTKYELQIRKYKFADGVDMHQIAYGDYKYEDGVMSWRDMVNTSEEEDLFDAAFKMVCWILKNKK